MISFLSFFFVSAYFHSNASVFANELEIDLLNEFREVQRPLERPFHFSIENKMGPIVVQVADDDQFRVFLFNSSLPGSIDLRVLELDQNVMSISVQYPRESFALAGNAEDLRRTAGLNNSGVSFVARDQVLVLADGGEYPLVELEPFNSEISGEFGYAELLVRIPKDSLLDLRMWSLLGNLSLNTELQVFPPRLDGQVRRVRLISQYGSFLLHSMANTVTTQVRDESLLIECKGLFQ